MRDMIKEAIEKYRHLILDAERYIWKNPETGYKEWKTSRYLEKEFEGLDYTLTRAGNIPGFYTNIDTGRPGPKVLILGELDALISPQHQECDPQTGAVHCCGHNAQSAALLGIAAALREPGIISTLCGQIMLCAVPAEELIEIEYREGLIAKGDIKFFGGKIEFLHRGYFDDVDIAFMVHTAIDRDYYVQKGAVGFISKRITYKGVASHAAGCPQNGINALYAAGLGLNAINAIRETFVEEDLIRVHPIITGGGVAVSAIPDNVTVECLVRGKTLSAIKKANEKVNRALVGAAVSIGANIDISDRAGYAPLENDDNMIRLACEAIDSIAAENSDVEFKKQHIGTGSTDMGDISMVFPSVHPYVGGAVGRSHGSDYYIYNPERACLDSVALQLTMLHMLLSDNAQRAKYIIENKSVPFNSIKEYIETLNSLEGSGERIAYKDGGAELKLN